MALFEVNDLDRKIYEEELRDFLPDKMIDIHTHLWLRSLRPPKKLAPGEVKRTVTWPSLVAAENSIEDLQETYRLMFPGKEVSALVFASTERETAPALNDYVSQAARRVGFPALYYSVPEERGHTGRKRAQRWIPWAKELFVLCAGIFAQNRNPHFRFFSEASASAHG